MAFPETYFTPDEYLRREREALEKSEYYNGQIYAMAGASRAHGLIVSNCTALLWLQLRGKPCEVHASDLRTRIAATGAYVYPDVTVACNPEVDPDYGDNLLNPKAVIEVLSPSTERHDQNAKWAHYQELPSLEHYVLIWQDRPKVVHYRRDPSGWNKSELTHSDDLLPLDAVGCELRLSEIYDRIIFSAAGEH